MKYLFAVSYARLTLRIFRDYIFDKKKRSIGRHVHRQTLTRVLFAPVNLFFDVTPIGKILSIFNGDLQVFYGQILEPFHIMIEISAHVIVVLSIFCTIGNWYVFFILCFMAYIMSFLTERYLAIDNSLHKVGNSLWTPVRSYFHESMRGTAVIRAFGQEETIMARQNELLDHTTTSFIVHHSCWVWYNIRMFTATKIFALCAILICFMSKGKVSDVTLTLMLSWTLDMGWFMHFFGCMNWFGRMMVQA